MAGRRRGKGEGSIYQRADGRWIGAITVGYAANGKQKRKTVSGRTQQEALRKLRAAQRQADEGLPPSNDNVTVANLLDQWIRTVLPRQVAPNALSNYESIVRNHINPAIGSKRVSRLTTQDVDELIASKLAERSTSTVRRIRSVLSAGLEQGLIGESSREMLPRHLGPRG